ncbi:MAG: S41 family peptidase [Selenomonadaceae bacterium]|nr:S41 family peptidase [Selenomonadaceae bacterium]
MSKKKVFLIIGLTALVTFLSTLLALGVVLTKVADVRPDDAARFIGMYKVIRSRYVDQTDQTALFDGAISGMVRSLKDPHSVYLEPVMYRELLNQTGGTFGGIGVYMDFRDKKITVISVIEDTPAQKAGIMANDEIIAVDDVSVKEMEPGAVVLKIRGEIGTEVKLRLRSADGSERDVVLTRGLIKSKSVHGKMLDDSVAYIRISNFTEQTGNEFRETYAKMEGEGMKKIVLDLRQNPGGLVNTCVDVANFFVPKGVVVTVEDKDGELEEYNSNLDEVKYPLAVLVDGNSASASEILAGAIKDTKSGTLVGEKTFGKGSIQVVIPMFHNDAVKLTVAKYFTPSGVSIDQVGIKPDVEVKFSPGDKEDVQLKKAIEILNK